MCTYTIDFGISLSNVNIFVLMLWKVSERKIVIDIPTNSGVNADGITNKGGSVHVVPPFACNVNTVKAAMSKKKKCIEIVLSES